MLSIVKNEMLEKNLDFQIIIFLKSNFQNKTYLTYLKFQDEFTLKYLSLSQVCFQKYT